MASPKVRILIAAVFLFLARLASAADKDSNLSPVLPDSHSVRNARALLYDPDGDEWRRIYDAPQTTTFLLNTLYYLSALSTELDGIRTQSIPAQAFLLSIGQFVGYPGIIENFHRDTANISPYGNHTPRELKEWINYHQQMIVRAQARIFRVLPFRQAADVEWVLADFAKNGVNRPDLFRFGDCIAALDVRDAALMALTHWHNQRNGRKFEVQDLELERLWLELKNLPIQSKVKRYRLKGWEDYAEVSAYGLAFDFSQFKERVSIAALGALKATDSLVTTAIAPKPSARPPLPKFWANPQFALWLGLACACTLGAIVLTRLGLRV